MSLRPSSSASPAVAAKPHPAATRSATPQFELEPSWPKPLPEGWITGQLACVCVDHSDHVLIVNRGDITEEEKETCRRAPAVMIFDLEGNLIGSWGDWEVLPSTPHSCAVDRDNNAVAPLYQQFDPAVLHTIKHIIDAGHKRNVWVGMCGEMAGDPLCTSVLLAMGIDELSLNAGGIPMIKKVIRSLSMDQAKTDLRKLMKLDTAAQVREFILKKMKPLLEELDHRLFIAAGG